MRTTRIRFGLGERSLRWESIASGVAVIVCDRRGIGGMVTSNNLPMFIPRNFGRRLLSQPFDDQTLETELGLYDAEDAAKVATEVRRRADLDSIVLQFSKLYESAIDQWTSMRPTDLAEEMREFSRMLAYVDRTKLLWRTDFAASDPAPTSPGLRIYREPTVHRRAA